MPEFLILPGYGGSGPQHWQTLWEANPSFRRVHQRDWERPDRGEWAGVLEQAVAASADEVILVAHSLACLLVAHWAGSAAPGNTVKVRAALLVGPPDPAGPEFPPDTHGFAPVPRDRLPFASLVVASTDDPYASTDFCRACATDWGSRLEVIGPKGHINSASGLGDWPQGMALLKGLAGGPGAELKP